MRLHWRKTMGFLPFEEIAALLLLLLHVAFCGCFPLNDEGLALLAFRGAINRDPYSVLSNWNPYDDSPCNWHGVSCDDGNVNSIELGNLSLEGSLAPELGQLLHLKKVVLSDNNLSGTIPEVLGALKNLEIMNLSSNNLTGRIPSDIGNFSSLRSLILSNNQLQGNIPSELGMLYFLQELRLDRNQFTGTLPDSNSKNRRVGQRTSLCDLKDLLVVDFQFNNLEGKIPSCFDHFPRSIFQWNCFQDQNPEEHHSRCGSNHLSYAKDQREISTARILASTSDWFLPPTSAPAPVPKSGQKPEAQAPVTMRTAIMAPSPSTNAAPSPQLPPTPSVELLPTPAPSPADSTTPFHNSTDSAPSPTSKAGPPSSKLSSESRIAKPSVPGVQNATTDHSKKTVKYVYAVVGPKKTVKYVYAVVGPVVGLFVISSFVALFICHKRKLTTIKPWRTGISGQLQKAFITGAPKLNRPELEAACEEFSNVIGSSDESKAYKGTLSSGVEIAVTSTTISHLEDWSPYAEMLCRKKIEVLSRVNHKNFVNLLGYCIEDDPFTRMMVFEYAPNGTLYEHLHVRDAEQLNWAARMRIIMGVAYCLQYMHEKEPPICHPNINSNAIYLTDDFAAKLADLDVWKDAATAIKEKRCFSKSYNLFSNDVRHNSEGSLMEAKNNIHSLGLLLIEIISGRIPYAKEDESYISWARGYLVDPDSMKYLVDPSLNDYNADQLEKVCDVIQACIEVDPLQRPSIKDIIAKLREALPISPDAASPKLSPLWWAELEVLAHDGS